MAARSDRARLPRDISGWISEHPSIDLAVAAAILTAHVTVTRRGHGDLLAWLDSAQRQAVYGAGAGVVAVLGGLTAIAWRSTAPPLGTARRPSGGCTGRRYGRIGVASYW